MATLRRISNQIYSKQKHPAIHSDSIPTSKYNSVSNVLAKTTSVTHNVNFKWEIDNFSIYQTERILSPQFFLLSNDEVKFNLELYPNGNKKVTREYIAIYLYYASYSKAAYHPASRIQYSLSLLNSNGDKCYTIVSTAKLDCTYGRQIFVLCKKLFDEANELLPNNKLTVLCEVTSFSDRFNMTTNSPTNVETEEVLKLAECELASNLGAMLEDTKSGDVVLRVDGLDFRAHKSILKARSPVFRAMFEHNLNETKQNLVVIIDVDAYTFRQLLKFIYTGKIAVGDVTTELLSAADKYQLDTLKSICEHRLSELLEIENVALVLLIADMHSANHLKIKCIDFINKDNNSAQVIATQGWKDLFSVRPELVGQLYQHLVTSSAHKKRKLS